ncbi:hypothetical protein ACH4F6_06975 [Streptomyces sp. NPDC017936]|uniref:hypothetical protein n=1 Tax=Streptomyces sp. NPDC017936 TaxID=3365016 RepID=UPI0037BDF9C8
MSGDERDDERDDELPTDDTPWAGALAVTAVLAPVLAGASAAIFLLVGYVLRLLDAGRVLAGTLLATGWVFGAMTAAAILVAGVGLLITALRSPAPEAEAEPEAPRRPARPSGRAAHRTLGVASFVAGHRRAHLREEWAAILAGDPDNGIVLSPRRRTVYALGFLWAALRLRLRDLAAPLWLPVDWLLSADSRTNGLTAAAVGAQVLYIRHEDGLHALLTEGWGWCAGCGIALRLLFGWLRRVRGIELASTPDRTADS